MTDDKQYLHAVVPAEQPPPVWLITEERADQSPVHTAYGDDTETQRKPPYLQHVRIHTTTHDGPGITHDQRYEQGDEIYDAFPPRRKILIVIVLSFCSFPAPISSTSILAASPEVVNTFHTTGHVFGVFHLVFMGISPLFYGPLASCFGRKSTLTAVRLLAAVAKSLPCQAWCPGARWRDRMDEGNDNKQKLCACIGARVPRASPLQTGRFD